MSPPQKKMPNADTATSAARVTITITDSAVPPSAARAAASDLADEAAIRAKAVAPLAARFAILGARDAAWPELPLRRATAFSAFAGGSATLGCGRPGDFARDFTRLAALGCLGAVPAAFLSAGDFWVCVFAGAAVVSAAFSSAFRRALLPASFARSFAGSACGCSVLALMRCRTALTPWLARRILLDRASFSGRVCSSPWAATVLFAVSLALIAVFLATLVAPVLRVSVFMSLTT